MVPTRVQLVCMVPATAAANVKEAGANALRHATERHVRMEYAMAANSTSKSPLSFRSIMPYLLYPRSTSSINSTRSWCSSETEATEALAQRRLAIALAKR